MSRVDLRRQNAMTIGAVNIDNDQLAAPNQPGKPNKIVYNVHIIGKCFSFVQ